MLPETLEFNKIFPKSLNCHVIDNETIISIGNNQISSNSVSTISQGLAPPEIKSYISGISMSSCYKRNLVIATEYDVKLFCAKPWKERRTLLKSSDTIRSIAQQEDGFVAVGTDAQEIKLLNLHDPTFTNVLEGHKNAVKHLEFSPCGAMLVSSSCDGNLRIWAKNRHSDDWNCIDSLTDVINSYLPESETNYPIQWYRDGTHFVSANAEGQIQVIESISWETKAKIKAPEPPAVISFSPNGLYMASLGSKNTITVWKMGTEAEEILNFEHSCKLTGISWHPSQNDLVLSDDVGDIIYYPNVIPKNLPSSFKEVDIIPLKQLENKGDSNLDLFGDDESPFADLDALEETVGKEDNQEEVGSQATEDEGEDLEDFIEDDDGGGYLEDLTKERNMEKYQRRSMLETIEKIEREYGESGLKGNSPSTARKVIEAEIQKAFQPGCCSANGEKQYLVLNMIGSVSVVESGLQYTVDVKFHDMGKRQFHFTNNIHYVMAALGNAGLICASECTTSFPSSVYYHPFNTWGTNNDWSVTLPDGENVLAVAVGDSQVVVATDQNYLRFYSSSGIQTGVRSLPGPAVSVAAFENLLLAVYHQGGVFHGNQSLSYFLMDMKSGEFLREHSLPISPYSTLTWIGFSKIGIPLSYDSLGVLRALYYRNSIMWSPIFESKVIRGTKSDIYWPVGASDDAFFCVICRGRSEPEFPNPMITDLPLKIPFCMQDTERGKLEAGAVLNRLNLLHQKGSNESDIDLVDIAKKEAQLDKLALQLFLNAVKNDNTQRAMEISLDFNSMKCFDGAIKLANMNRLSSLAERIGNLKMAKYRESQAVQAKSSIKSKGPEQVQTISQTQNSQQVQIIDNSYSSQIFGQVDDHQEDSMVVDDEVIPPSNPVSEIKDTSQTNQPPDQLKEPVPQQKPKNPFAKKRPSELNIFKKEEIIQNTLCTLDQLKGDKNGDKKRKQPKVTEMFKKLVYSSDKPTVPIEKRQKVIEPPNNHIMEASSSAVPKKTSSILDYFKVIESDSSAAQSKVAEAESLQEIEPENQSIIPKNETLEQAKARKQIEAMFQSTDSLKENKPSNVLDAKGKNPISPGLAAHLKMMAPEVVVEQENND